MDNRWCILGGPRSGHTWCEHLVFGGIAELPNSIQLNEFLHPGVAAQKNDAYVLDIDRNILSLPNMLLDLDNFFTDRCKLIFKANTTQPLTMVIIPEPWTYNNIDYIDFIQLLNRSGNFKIARMHRNLFDRAVSWYYMSVTQIVHQFKEKKETAKFTIETGGQIEGFVSPVIKADTSKFMEFLVFCIRDEIYMRTIESQVKCIRLNYDTLIEDCKQNNIPFDADTAIKKTHSVQYQNLIENYDELLDMYNLLKNIL
jgi:hypothetical protein